MEGQVCIFAPKHMKNNTQDKFLSLDHVIIIIFFTVPHLCTTVEIIKSEHIRPWDKHAVSWDIIGLHFLAEKQLEKSIACIFFPSSSSSLSLTF